MLYCDSEFIYKIYLFYFIFSQTKSSALLVDYVCYIKEQSEKSPQTINFDEFISVIQIKTNHGLKNPCETAIHFTPAYGNFIDLKQDLSGKKN